MKGKPVAILDLSFKDGRDDVRESREIPLAEGLASPGSSPSRRATTSR